MRQPIFNVPSHIQGPARSYLIEQLLGRGGFGETYLGRSDDGVPIVVKVLLPDRMDSWKSFDLFQREANALQAIAHPRVPALLDFFVLDGAQARPVLGGDGVLRALETSVAPRDARIVQVRSFVPGHSLQEMLDAGHVFLVADVELLACGILDILSALHEQPRPVIHRDIKPSNIIIGSDGAPHVIDFGSVQFGQGSGSTMVGSFGYFPQEQLLGQARPASDIYALGMTLLVVLTGEPPEAQHLDPLTGKVRVPLDASHRLIRLIDAFLVTAAEARPSARAALQSLRSPEPPRQVPPPQVGGGHPSRLDSRVREISPNVARYLRELDAQIRLPGGPGREDKAARVASDAPVGPVLHEGWCTRCRRWIRGCSSPACSKCGTTLM